MSTGRMQEINPMMINPMTDHSSGLLSATKRILAQPCAGAGTGTGIVLLLKQ